MIEFFDKMTGLAVKNECDWYFIKGDGSVWSDNGKTCESQCAVVGFDDFTKPCPTIGWRFVAPNVS